MHCLLLLVVLLSFIIYSLYLDFIRNSNHYIFSVIHDDSPTCEPLIDITESDTCIGESDVSLVGILVGSPSLVGLTPLSPLGIPQPSFISKSFLITYHLFTALDF